MHWKWQSEWLYISIRFRLNMRIHFAFSSIKIMVQINRTAPRVAVIKRFDWITIPIWQLRPITQSNITETDATSSHLNTALLNTTICGIIIDSPGRRALLPAVRFKFPAAASVSLMIAKGTSMAHCSFGTQKIVANKAQFSFEMALICQNIALGRRRLLDAALAKQTGRPTVM